MIDTITLYLDDANGSGDVTPPSLLELTVGGSTVQFDISDPDSGDPFAFTATGIGLTGESARVRLIDGSQRWIMLSEVEFFGDPVPAPATASLLAVCAGFGSRRRR